MKHVIDLCSGGRANTNEGNLRRILILATQHGGRTLRPNCFIFPEKIRTVYPACGLNNIICRYSSRGIICGIEFGVDIAPLTWKGLFTYRRYAVGYKGFVPLLVILHVAQHTCTVRPENGVVNCVFDFLSNHSV